MSYFNSAFPVDQVHLQVLTMLPLPFHNLPIRVTDRAITMKLSILELASVNLPIVPFENPSAIHLSILKGSFVLSCLCLHLAMTDFQISSKLSDVFAFAIFHNELTVALHVSVLELPLVHFTWWPFVCRIIVTLDSVNEVSHIGGAIRVYLSTMAVGFVIHPLSIVHEIAAFVDEFAVAFKLSIFYGASFIWTIWVYVYTIWACNLALWKWTLKIGSI